MKYGAKRDGVPSDLVTEIELADRLNISRSFLRKMRCEGGGPKYYKLGVSVRYSLADALGWLEAQSSVS